MEKKIKLFLEFLQKDKKLSNNTLQSYKRDLKQFKNFIEACEVTYNRVDEETIKEYIQELEEKMKEKGVGKIASLSGRFYAMDRDKRWNRVQKAYDAMVFGKGETAGTAINAIESSYQKEVFDEFVEPTVICNGNEPVAKIEENDSVIFFNFRPDRAREITRAIVSDEFSGFEKSPIKCYFVCLTEYDVTIENVHIAFKPASLANTLGEYLSKNGKTQLRAAETEKYAHVTHFFDGTRDINDKRIQKFLVPSPSVPTYDMKPEMSVGEVTETVLKQMEEDYDFILVNFANPDMVGHTGNFERVVDAIEICDFCLGKIYEKAKEYFYELIITADHGNAEKMLNRDKTPITSHTTSKVPFIICDEEIKLKEGGSLSDIAPTITDIYEIKKPDVMTGSSLIIKDEEI